MKEFWTLFKYEFKMQMPLFGKKKKFDLLGSLFIFLIIAFLVCAIVVFLSQILQNYVLVEIDKTYEPIERAKEMLSLFYLVLLFLMTILILERTRKIFADDKNKQVFLRLPLSKRNVFLSKFAVLLIHTYIVGVVYIITISSITASVLPLGAQFWLSTIAVCLFLPIVCLLLVSLLIVPYIKVIELLVNKYSVLFVLFTIMLVVAFILYSNLLNIIQTLLTTGSIRYLFNENFVDALKWVYKFAYPVNAMVAILFEKKVLLSYVILILFVLIAMGAVYLISKNLYRITLYRQPKNDIKVKKPTKIKQKGPILALLKKEFICVYRQPKHIFAYFSVAMSMPIMVYSCFTLFETLIYTSLGIHINFALALSTVLLFDILTNTFCSTNITRDGYGILKMKTLPLAVSKIFWAKVLFCAMVSSIAVFVSCLLLVLTTSLQIFDGLICLLIGLMFTFAQIFIATKLDLKHAKISMSDMEADDHSSKTLSKVVLLGGALTLLASATSVFFALFVGEMKIVNNAMLLQVGVYLVPFIVGIVYLLCGFLYFRANITKSFERLVN
ncbi:MAG: hypothetical protein J6C62_05555 [Clostridia bacterium]|nr:hypothetical protein [Clostridia bacterium]